MKRVRETIDRSVDRSSWLSSKLIRSDRCQPYVTASICYFSISHLIRYVSISEYSNHGTANSIKMCKPLSLRVQIYRLWQMYTQQKKTRNHYFPLKMFQKFSHRIKFSADQFDSLRFTITNVHILSWSEGNFRTHCPKHRIMREHYLWPSIAIEKCQRLHTIRLLHEVHREGKRERVFAVVLIVIFVVVVVFLSFPLLFLFIFCASSSPSTSAVVIRH